MKLCLAPVKVTLLPTMLRCKRNLRGLCPLEMDWVFHAHQRGWLVALCKILLDVAISPNVYRVPWDSLSMSRKIKLSL